MAGSKLLRQIMLIFVLFFCTPVSADVLDEILERGTIRVGVAEFVPWTLKNKAGELIGFEIEVARKVIPTRSSKKFLVNFKMKLLKS